MKSMMYFVLALQLVVVSQSNLLRSNLLVEDGKSITVPLEESNYDGKEANKGNTIEVDEEILDGLGTARSLQEVLKRLGIKEQPTKAPLNKKIGFKTSLFDIQKKLSDFSKPTAKLRSKTEGRYIENPSQAFCEPELKTVDLGFPRTFGTIYYPSCVRVKQCGGCCTLDIYSCQPTVTEKVTVKVVKIVSGKKSSENLLGRRSRRRRVAVEPEYVNATIEEHTKCSCACKLKENVCDLDIHYYDDRSCECVCKNEDERNKCFGKSTHIWDPVGCKCLCRGASECSTGYEYDHNICWCRPKHADLLTFLRDE